MTFPIAGVVTVPFCGSCGRETLGPFAHEDLAADLICDGCGADLLAYGWTAGLLPPTTVAIATDDPGVGDFQVTFVENAGADTNTVQYRINGGAWVTDALATSPHDVLGPFAVSSFVEVQVKSIDGGVSGPWTTIVSATFAANSTGATAGIPGVWTPPDSRPPADLADITALLVIPDPGTLWTVGQSVVTLDANDAYWDGVSDWVLGTAPA
jgi:hypothetical protein